MSPVMDHRPTILLVDDEAMLRSAFCDLLVGHGFRCITAANAVDALQIIEANLVKLDLLLSDIKMPGELNGLDLANRVRELQPEVAIVLISGHADGSTRRDVRERGYRLLEKPFRQFHLVAAINGELGKRNGQTRDPSEGGGTVVPLKKGS